MTDGIAKTKAERRRDQAIAYVWGRQDAGDGDKDTDVSIQFGTFCFGRAYEYHSGASSFLNNIKSEWEEWSKR
jgi:hypothetical protein